MVSFDSLTYFLEYCCGGCNDEINGPAIQVLNKKYHPDCFNCTNCKLNIPKKCGGKFQQNEGKPYCNPCYDKVTWEHSLIILKTFGKFGFCGGCGQKLDRGGIEAMGSFVYLSIYPKDINGTKNASIVPSVTKTFPMASISSMKICLIVQLVFLRKVLSFASSVKSNCQVVDD